MKVLAILFFLLSFAPNKEANIIIIDNKTKEELIGAKLTIDSTTYYTDFDGIIHLSLPSKESYDINIEYPSYETKKLDDVELKSMIIELKQK
jgi:hypothetical protein